MLMRVYLSARLEPHETLLSSVSRRTSDTEHATGTRRASFLVRAINTANEIRIGHPLGCESYVSVHVGREIGMDGWKAKLELVVVASESCLCADEELGPR
jgi:hypothetical protein